MTFTDYEDDDFFVYDEDDLLDPLSDITEDDYDYREARDYDDEDYEYEYYEPEDNWDAE